MISNIENNILVLYIGLDQINNPKSISASLGKEAVNYDVILNFVLETLIKIKRFWGVFMILLKRKIIPRYLLPCQNNMLICQNLGFLFRP